MKKYMCLEVSDGTADGYLYGSVSGNGAIEAHYIGRYVQPKNIHPIKTLLYDKVDKEFSDAVYEVYTYGPEKLKLMVNELAFKQRAKSYIQNTEMSEERMKVFLLQNNLLDKMYETMLSVGISEDRFPVILSVIAKEGLE